MSTKDHYLKAKEYFNLPKGWVLHHIDPELKYKDPQRYNEWRIEDLKPMTKSEHAKIHCWSYIGPGLSVAGRERLSITIRGNKNGYHTETEETKKKKSDFQKSFRTGKKLYNNGKINKLFTPGEEPEGWVSGKVSNI